MKYKIYKLIDNTNGNIYIGQTKRKLYLRLDDHKQDYKKGYQGASKKIIANGNYKIELIEETDDKTRERYWVENTECINIRIPGRTIKEYDKIKNSWYSSMGGSPYNNNNSLLKIDISLFE